MAPKRSGGHGKTSAMKKQKLDPISQKVKDLTDFLKDDECPVPGPEACRTGLLAALPHALGLGAASDERHCFQIKMSTIVGEILDASKAKWQKRLEDAQATFEAGKAEKASRDAALEDTKGRLSTSKTVVDEAKAQHKEDISSEVSARTNLKGATAEVDNFDSMQLEKEKEKEEYAALFTNVFQVLMVGEGDKKQERAQLNSLTTKLRKLKVDESLLSAMGPALTKTSTDRGDFDHMVVAQIEDAMKQHVASLEDELNNGVATKAQKVSDRDAMQAVLDAAEAKLLRQALARMQAEGKVTELEAEEQQNQASCRKQEEVLSDLNIQVYTEQCRLDFCQETQKKFVFLRDRVATMPESEEKLEPEATDVFMAVQEPIPAQ